MKRVMVVLATSLSVVACTGTKGDTGPAGPAGAAGPAGVAGPAGAAGSVGSPGAMGSAGTMGTAGAMGTPGAMGTAGAMGTPGTMGVAGLDGQSVHVSALDAGSQCAGGGALLTSSDGGTVTVCNGTPADTYLYGDGSAGPLVISTDTEWIDPILNNGVPTNLQFTDVTINAGVTFTVISGLTIKASGSFVNNGLIVVNSWGGAGGQDMEEEPVSTGGATVPVTARAIPAQPGIARSSAVAGYRTRRATVSGGQGGSAMLSGQARQLVRFGSVGGGGGAPGPAGYGGSGGGTLTILAKNLLRNAGNIRADGQSSMFTCSGGGGGGIVLLASATTIENTGAVRARGGHGGESETTVCSGGGGGSGGLVHFIAPNIISGTRIVLPGIGGVVNGAPVNRAALASPGGGGGATASAGGWGGGLTTELRPGADGNDGVVLDTQVNPAGLFF